MKNKILLALAAFMLTISFVNEPIQDTIDIVAGATNQTYGTSVDSYASASTNGSYDDDGYEEEDDD